ncbi:SHOCT domain-containing protein [Streptomyces sp. enrichment culture]|uniref:SHOCT domain-containing protein n=1 Tax=Streptomyces sp. enrichment culture TaxID=1795815 RepID=UPI003F568F0C
MNTLAHTGPGPWVLLIPLFWAGVAVVVVLLLRRTTWRGGRGPLYRDAAARPPGDPSPVELLGRRFAAGEIDEEEYGRRLSVLDERFGPGRKT